MRLRDLDGTSCEEFLDWFDAAYRERVVWTFSDRWKHLSGEQLYGAWGDLLFMINRNRYTSEHWDTDKHLWNWCVNIMRKTCSVQLRDERRARGDRDESAWKLVMISELEHDTFRKYVEEIIQAGGRAHEAAPSDWFAECMQRFTPKQRDAVESLVFGEMRSRDAVEMLGVTGSSLHKHKTCAIKKAKKIFLKHHDLVDRRVAAA